MTKRVASQDKRETFLLLYQSVFALEASKGHLAWKVTDLVRKSGLSRSLIYKYLGSSKSAMLKTVVRDFISDFYGMDGPFRDLSLADHIMKARQQMMDNPDAIVYYQKWRSKNSPEQKQFTEIEARFQKKLRAGFPNATPDEILGYHALIHGLVTAPFLTAEQSAMICGIFFKKNRVP